MHESQNVRWRFTLWGWLRVLTLLVAVPGYFLLAEARPTSATESDIPGSLAEAVRGAVAGWGEFASTGDLAAVESSFAEGGPQRQQLEAESVAWTDDGASEPLRFVIRELRLRRLGAETATVWARVEVTRSGFEPRLFSWDFDLVLRDGRWHVWTVVAAQPPDPSPADTEAAAATPTTLSTTTTSSPLETGHEHEELAAPPLAEANSPIAGVRLPLLSAWIIVVTIVGVALAGYLAPRIDRKEEG